MRIGVCGIACEECPRRIQETCPNHPQGCVPKPNKFCAIATCAHEEGVGLCFECAEFPCETTKAGPIATATANTSRERADAIRQRGGAQ